MSDASRGPVKRSVTIAGHRTSLSLEPEFWDALNALATVRNVPLAGLVAAIDEARGRTNLSSALRVAVLQATRTGEI
ncbi:MAG: ribbon-helix-helix domain-containing protein [Pseudomonadota bacterium]